MSVRAVQFFFEGWDSVIEGGVPIGGGTGLRRGGGVKKNVGPPPPPPPTLPRESLFSAFLSE